MAYGSPHFGETTQLYCEIESRDGETFTLVSATVTITNSTGTKLRNNVAASVDNDSDPPRAYYSETFTAANGYTEGELCKAMFRVVIGSNVEIHEDSFVVESVAGLP